MEFDADLQVHWFAGARQFTRGVECRDVFELVVDVHAPVGGDGVCVFHIECLKATGDMDHDGVDFFLDADVFQFPRVEQGTLVDDGFCNHRRGLPDIGIDAHEVEFLEFENVRHGAEEGDVRRATFDVLDEAGGLVDLDAEFLALNDE